MDEDDFEPHGYDQRCQVCGTITDAEYCSDECYSKGEEEREALADADLIELEMLWQE